MNGYIDNISDTAIDKLYSENWDSVIDRLVLDFTNVNNRIKSKTKVNMFLDFSNDKDVYTIYYKNLETNIETRTDFNHAYHLQAHVDYLLKISMIL